MHLNELVNVIWRVEECSELSAFSKATGITIVPLDAYERLALMSPRVVFGTQDVPHCLLCLNAWSS